jgi:undecaprenyl-diphosphatase
MWQGIILGVLQGVTEWLPISSQGTVTIVNNLLFDSTLADALTFALWLHLGTSLSALFVFRREIRAMFAEFFRDPKHPSPLFRYLVVATITSAAIGFPLLLLITELSNSYGLIAMGLVGVFMLITGALQLRRKSEGTRGQPEINAIDGLVAGIAQGFAVLPGFSRSGLTVAALLYRKVDRREALILSFLMSVPVSLGAATYTSIDGGFYASQTALVAMGVAAVVGLVTIKGLIAVAQRINFAMFVIVAGAAILAGAALTAVFNG